MQPISVLFIFLSLCTSISGSLAMDSVVSTSSSIAKKEFSSTASEQLAQLLLEKWHESYEEKEFDKIKKLIDDGADIHKPIAIYRDGEGKQYTPLAIAALFGHYELAKILLEKGADVNNMQSDRYTAVPDYVDNTMNTRAIDSAWTEPMCILLLDAGTDVHGKGVLGYTAVHRIATDADRKKLDAIKGKWYLLMQYGADIRKKNAIGYSAIDIITALEITEARKNNLIDFLNGGKQFTDYCKARMKNSYDGNDTNIVTSIRTQQIYGPWHKSVRQMSGQRSIRKI